MSLQFHTSTNDDVPEWELWRWDIDYRRASMYTPEPPYQRYEMTVTATSTQGLQEMEGMSEKSARGKGYVTFPELSVEAQEFWAERDAKWLAYSILKHIADK